jgi:hypothetical protein
VKKRKAAEKPMRDLPKPGKQYPGVHGKIVIEPSTLLREG